MVAALLSCEPAAGRHENENETDDDTKRSVQNESRGGGRVTHNAGKIDD